MQTLAPNTRIGSPKLGTTVKSVVPEALRSLSLLNSPGVEGLGWMLPPLSNS